MKLSPGSISSGTLRLPDILRRFANTLALHAHAGNQGIIADACGMARMMDDYPELMTDEDVHNAQMVIDALSKRLQDITPAGYYFGAHPDDGADFGVWEHPDDAYTEQEIREEWEQMG